MSKLTLVLGIRPDLIRASLIIKELKSRLGSQFEFVWSGQHYSTNMKDVFFRQLDVPSPDVTFDLKKETDISIIASIMKHLAGYLEENQPKAVLYLGDTNTVLSSIVPASMNIPIVHIEGCMRSYDWRMPEEKYRTTVDHLSDVIYAYLEEYKTQGVLEGLESENIIVTGNPIVDVLEEYFISGKTRMDSVEIFNLMTSHDLSPGEPFWVMTCHRRENVDSRDSLSRIMELSKRVGEKVVFFAGYRTQRQLIEHEITIPKNVRLFDPTGYIEILELMWRSQGVLTDSGTIVEEAAVLGIPSIQMRTATERPQVYDCGASIKFDPQLDTNDFYEIVRWVKSSGKKKFDHGLGDGRASERIVEDLVRRVESDDWNGHQPSKINKPVWRSYGSGTQ